MTPLEFLKSKGIRQGVTTWHSEDICELLKEYGQISRDTDLGKNLQIAGLKALVSLFGEIIKVKGSS